MTQPFFWFGQIELMSAYRGAQGGRSHVRVRVILTAAALTAYSLPGL